MSTESTVLVLGASGMLGHAVIRYFSSSPGFVAFGSARSANSLQRLPQELRSRITYGLDADNMDGLAQLIARVQPDVVINCIGLVKQLPQSGDPVAAITINSLLPHRLLALCKEFAARLIHVSTDCVFSGTKGMYREEDIADASDMYGRSK